MTRFAATTLLGIAAAAAVISTFDGWTRFWIMMALWIIYGGAIASGVVWIQWQFFGPALCRGPATLRQVALTFDDGPDPAATPALLDLLAREKIHAAFFCIGKNVAANPELTSRIAAEGHLLANHTCRHLWQSVFFFRRAWLRELTATQDVIARAAGVTPKFMRPPIGLTNPHLRAALRQTALTLAGWDVRSLDTDPRRSPSQIIDRVVQRSRPGSIILLHDGNTPPQRLTEITTGIIAQLRTRGYEFTRLDQLLQPLPPESPG